MKSSPTHHLIPGQVDQVRRKLASGLPRALVTHVALKRGTPLLAMFLPQLPRGEPRADELSSHLTLAVPVAIAAVIGPLPDCKPREVSTDPWRDPRVLRQLVYKVIFSRSSAAPRRIISPGTRIMCDVLPPAPKYCVMACFMRCTICAIATCRQSSQVHQRRTRIQLRLAAAVLSLPYFGLAILLSALDSVLDILIPCVTVSSSLDDTSFTISRWPGCVSTARRAQLSAAAF
ncbi:hypothetical protein DM02DRAFT_661464 [Periconia macrospinosa]|uniref:Uncharacterized protein n=1 Tax=Periconia macrospinosa TaxID=97972 RepID=A0A2V1D9V6_9PLEO|nr:hypothetical protein DM02DRAFT_661464 [Periconia macrospinosa]